MKRAINYQVLYGAGNPPSKGKQGPVVVVFFFSAVFPQDCGNQCETNTDHERSWARGRCFAKQPKRKCSGPHNPNASENGLHGNKPIPWVRHLQISQKTCRRLKLPLPLTNPFSITWSLATQERCVAFVVWGQGLIETGSPHSCYPICLPRPEFLWELITFRACCFLFNVSVPPQGLRGVWEAELTTQMFP